MITQPSPTRFEAALSEHSEALQRTADSCRTAFTEMAALWAGCLRRGGRIFFFGNGGSAGDAQHLAAELTGRLRRERDPLAGLALTTDSSALTAIGNDYGFESVFERQLRALGRAGDIAVGISTSGNSLNILKALSTARQMGLTATGLAGRDGGAMVELCKPLLIVPCHSTARIQEMHILLGHALIEAMEDLLQPGDEG